MLTSSPPNKASPTCAERDPIDVHSKSLSTAPTPTINHSCAIISTSPVTIPDIQIPISGRYTYNDDKGVSRTLSGAIDLGQIKTIAKERIVSQKVCTLKNEINDIDSKLLNIFGLAQLLEKKENTIKSLQGKVAFLKEKIKV